jgi:nucleoside phosphorylase
MALVDFAIVTALGEEFEVLRRFLPDLTEIAESTGVWYRTQVRADNGVVYSLVAAFQDQMGPLDAHSLTVRLIDRWDPAAIVLVGIAGSFSNDIPVGDVMVSQQVFYYGPAKEVPKGTQYRPQGYPTSVVLTRQFEALRLDPAAFKQWQNDASESATAMAKTLGTTVARGSTRKVSPARRRRMRQLLRAHEPEVHFGTIASGEKVITNPAKRKEILRLHGKILGTEMEGAGLMHASFSHREIPTHAVVVKGVSDPADDTKDKLDKERHWRELAKENPVRLVLALLRRGRLRPLNTDQYEVDQRNAPPTAAAQIIGPASRVAFQAFPRLVLPRGPLTALRIEIEAAGAAGRIHVLKHVVTYATAQGPRRLEGKSPVQRVEIAEVILPHPIGVYLMLGETPTSVRFHLTTPAQTAEVHCPLREGRTIDA